MSRFWLLILPVRAQLAAQQFSCGSFLQKVQEKVQEAFTLQMQHNSNLTEKPGGGGTPYNYLYGEAPPERGTIFRR